MTPPAKTKTVAIEKPRKNLKTTISYVKLQDAYVAEKGISVGSWKQIGYLMNNSTNFDYCDAAECNGITTNPNGYGGEIPVDSTYALENGWHATNVAALNDCAKGGGWNLKTAANGTTGGTIAWTASASSNDCEVLTPNYVNIGGK